VCQKWSLAPAACMFSKTCIFNTNAEHAICRRVLHSFGVPFKVKMDVSSRRYAHFEKGSFRSALVNTRNSVVFCSVFGAFWVSGCPLGGSISGPKVPPEGHRQAASWPKVGANKLYKNMHFLRMKPVLVGLGGPRGAPSGHPPGKGPTAIHDGVLFGKPPGDAGRDLREENEPQALKKRASQSMHFLRSKPVFGCFGALRLGLSAASRRGKQTQNTTEFCAQCRGSV